MKSSGKTNTFGMTPQRVITAMLLILAITSLLGCDTKVDQKKLDELSRSVEDSVSSITKKIGDLTPSSSELSSMTSEEIAKLFNFEYRVVEIDGSLAPVEIESKLSALGQDRWECFYVDRNGADLRVFCKRRPKTVLRYLPHIPFIR